MFLDPDTSEYYCQRCQQRGGPEELQLMVIRYGIRDRLNKAWGRNSTRKKPPVIQWPRYPKGRIFKTSSKCPVIKLILKKRQDD